MCQSVFVCSSFPLSLYDIDLILQFSLVRYDAIGEFNVDSEAECVQLN